MQQSKRSQKVVSPDLTVARELTDTELEIVCGGQKADDGNTSNSNQDALANLGNLGQMPSLSQLFGDISNLSN